MNVGMRRMHAVRNAEEFRARVDFAVEHAKTHLEEWRAEFAARPHPLDRVLVGLAIFIRDGRRERDTIVRLDAEDLAFWREYVSGLAARSDLAEPKVFETLGKPAGDEPRLIERVPYLACRFETPSTLSHALVGAVSRWRAATPDEMVRMQ